MMEPRLRQTLALAGVAQAGFLVYQLAHHGLAAHDKLAPLVQSLFMLNPKSAEDVYGGASKVRLGLQLLVEIIEDGTSSQANAETVRYALGLLYLQGTLRANASMLDTIREGVESIAGRNDEAARMEDAAMRELARLYQATISRLGRRIQVRGDMRYLQNDHVADKVRVALFAGVRSAVLWHQLGGRRWHLLLHRRRLLADARELLALNRL